MTQPTALAATLLDPQVQKCPFATYGALRDEAPVALDPLTGMYVVTRYADIRAVAANPGLFSNDTRQLSGRQTEAALAADALMRQHGVHEVNTMVTNDPPSHTRYRTLVDKAFAPARINALRPRIAEIARELVAAIPEGPFDAMAAIAVPLPIRVIAEQLGVPPHLVDRFKEWSDATIAAIDPALPPDAMMEAARKKIDMNLFLAAKADELRGTGDDSLIAVLASLDIDGVPLDRHELCSVLVQLLVGGNETSTSAIGSAVWHLATDRALQDRIRSEPALAKAFTEEVLRLESPLQGLFRRATATTELDGVPIPEGAILNIRWAAGNRDPAIFPDGDRIDLDRLNRMRHLSFGHGIHFCIGNQLARAEIEIAVQALLAEFGRISLARDGAADRISHIMAYGLSRLDVVAER